MNITPTNAAILYLDVNIVFTPCFRLKLEKLKIRPSSMRPRGEALKMFRRCHARCYIGRANGLQLNYEMSEQISRNAEEEFQFVEQEFRDVNVNVEGRAENKLQLFSIRLI